MSVRPCVSSVASKRKTSVLPNRLKKIIQNEKRKASTGKMEKTKKIFICCGLKTETETILVCVVSYFKRSRCVSSYLLRITSCFHPVFLYSSILLMDTHAHTTHTQRPPKSEGRSKPPGQYFKKKEKPGYPGRFCFDIIYLHIYRIISDRIKNSG